MTADLGQSPDVSTFVETKKWRLSVPEASALGRTVTIITIHPAGDQRVMRCAPFVCF